MNLGLRYELNLPPWETHGRIPVFSLTPPGSFEILKPRQALFAGDYNNFAPRVGLAYGPIEKTVVRAAYGIFYSEPKLLGLNVKSINPPLIVSQTFFSSAQSPLQFSRPFPVGLVVAGGVPAPNRRTPYVQEWSFNVQRQIGGNWLIDVGYVGNIALKMGRTLTLNVPLVPGPSAIQARRPLPDFGPATHMQFDSNNNHNGLLVHLKKQFSRGFAVEAAYTFSRNTGLSGDEMNGATIDPNNLNRDRGLSDSDMRHRLAVNYVGELPIGPGKPLLNYGGGRW